MSVFYAYISTKTTVDPFLPTGAASLERLARDVSDGFAALQGGRQMVGQIVFFPRQRSVPGHILCDGREVPKAGFPELYEFLGNTEGTPVDPDNFVLPNYIAVAALEPAPAADTETTTGGTVTTPPPAPIPGDPPPPPDLYGDVESGGRTRIGNNPIP